MHELWERIQATGLSATEITAIGDKMNKLRLEPKACEFEFFALQLMARQGTFLQDFQAFYRKRDELDRRLHGDQPNDRP